MSLARTWLESRPDARWVPLFDSDDRSEVVTFRHGHSDRRTLKRSPRFDEAMIELVESGLEDPDFRGILFVMAWGRREKIHPLYIGKAGRFGRDGESTSGNLVSIRTNDSKFARWGYGNAYHVGDLSQVLFGWTAYKPPSPTYVAWAEKLAGELAGRAIDDRRDDRVHGPLPAEEAAALCVELGRVRRAGRKEF